MARFVYTSYRKYAARYDLDGNSFAFYYEGRQAVVHSAKLLGAYAHGKQIMRIEDYKQAHGAVEPLMDGQRLHISYADGPAAQPELQISITLDRTGIEWRMECSGHLDIHIQGALDFGEDAFSVALNRRGPDLRAGLGPATSIEDDALFDRNSDMALELSGAPNTRIQYNWVRKGYDFLIRTGGDDVTRNFHVRVIERLYSDKFNIPYAPVNKKNTFPLPPVGWMTWYAVQFDAGERTVLENARFQREHLGPYGANTIWVDWEWYHSDFSGTNKEGVDIFHPDADRYPNGLAHVADEIKKLGFTPALWIGATNDPNENEFFRANPDAVIERRPAWCGQYFIDPTHPKIKSEFIPRAFGQIVEMGYEALKWDCLPISLVYWDRNHDKLHDPSVSTDQAMRTLMQIARDTVGPNFYMLSCSGSTMRDMGVGFDVFDAARIGGDIFRWREFVSQCIGRILKLYALHNVVLYCDPDNVVLREKYNDIEQARSRASLVGILGMPYTLGDNLPDLGAQRVSLIQHTIPAMDMHPMDVRENPAGEDSLIVNLAVAMPYEEWNVLDVINLREEEQRIRVDLRSDLHLPAGGGEKYLLFDYWNQAFLGEAETGFALSIGACASRVVGVRRKLDRPQVLGTTRHITQGALELGNVKYDKKKNLLSGTADVVGGDDYAIYFYLPEDLRPFHEGNDSPVFGTERVDIAEDDYFGSECPHGSVWRMPIRREHSETVHWKIAFTRCHPRQD